MKHGADEQNEDVREIPIWTRRYAQNRTLAFAVFLVIWIIGVAVLFFLGTGFDRAQASGSRLLAGVFVVLLAAVLTVMLWFRFVSAGRITRGIADRMYGSEGSASVASPESLKGRVPMFVYCLWAFCVLSTVGLILGGPLPYEYWVSVSAAFFVPFLLYAYVKFRDVRSPVMLLWPALYTLHALVSLSGLLVQGRPFAFPPKLQLLDMGLPILGYSLLAAVAAHIYSRIALRRLRALAASAETCQGGDERAQ